MLRGYLKAVRAYVRERRLDLRGLPAAVVGLTGLLLAVLTIGLAILVALAAGVELPGGRDGHPLDEPVPRVIVVFAYLALGSAAAALAAAMEHSGWRAVRLTRIALSLPPLTFSVAVADLSWSRREVLPASTHYTTMLTLSAIGAAASVAFALLPRRAASHASVAPALAAAPYAVGLAAYLAAGWPGGTIYEATPTAFVADRFLEAVVLGGIGGVLLIAWQAVAGSFAAVRDVGGVVARLSARHPLVVAAVVVLKLALVAVGYLVLAEVESPRTQPWHDSLHDGAVAWTLAFAFACAAALGLLLAAGSRIDTERLRRATWVLLAVFTSFVALAGVVALTATLAGALGWPSARRHAGQGALWLVEHSVEAQVAVILAALAGGAATLATRRAHPAISLLLVAFGAWSLPRAIGILTGNTSPAPELLTYDAALTLVVLPLPAIAAAVRASISLADVVLLLVSVSAIAYAGPLLRLVTSLDVLFYLSLAFPILYALLLDSEELNRSGDERPRRVLARTALAAAALALALAQIQLGLPGAGPEGQGTVARLLLAVPLAFLLVLSVVPLSRAAPRRA